MCLLANATVKLYCICIACRENLMEMFALIITSLGVFFLSWNCIRIYYTLHILHYILGLSMHPRHGFGAWIRVDYFEMILIQNLYDTHTNTQKIEKIYGVPVACTSRNTCEFEVTNKIPFRFAFIMVSESIAPKLCTIQSTKWVAFSSNFHCFMRHIVLHPSSDSHCLSYPRQTKPIQRIA